MVAKGTRALTVELPIPLVVAVKQTANDRQQTIKVIVHNALTEYLEKGGSNETR